MLLLIVLECSVLCVCVCFVFALLFISFALRISERKVAADLQVRWLFLHKNSDSKERIRRKALFCQWFWFLAFPLDSFLRVSISLLILLSCMVSTFSIRVFNLTLCDPRHARPPCPSPTPRGHPNPYPLSQWCHPTVSSSVIPFSSCPQSFPASGSFQMSQLFASGGQNIRVSLQNQSFQWTPRTDLP